LIAAIALAFVLGGELLVIIEEVVDLAFEWTHKMIDFLYVDIFKLEEEAAQKASAWTLFFLIAALIGWGCYVLYWQFMRAKTAAPRWWADQKAGWETWWTALPWYLKLAYALGGLSLVGILAMFI
jgi:hypothetical protein